MLAEALDLDEAATTTEAVPKSEPTSVPLIDDLALYRAKKRRATTDADDHNVKKAKASGGSEDTMDDT